jgi:hypothetical protein
LPSVDGDQLGEIYFETVGDLEHDLERGVDLAAFDRADVVAVQVGGEAERFL